MSNTDTPRRSSRSRTVRVRHDEIIPLTASSAPDRRRTRRPMPLDAAQQETEAAPIDRGASESPDTEQGPPSVPVAEPGDPGIRHFQEITRRTPSPPPCGQPESLTLPLVTYGQEAFDMLLGRLSTIQGIPVGLSPTTPLDSFQPLSPTYSYPGSFPSSLPSSLPLPRIPHDNGITSTVFIGLKRESVHLCRSFVERDIIQFEDKPLVGTTLIQIIARSESPVSRILEKWPIDHLTSVSTSSMPIEIEDEYYHHPTTEFTFIGALNTILDAPYQSPPISPIPPSPALYKFIEKMQLPNEQPVFVIYVLAEVCHILICVIIH